MKTYQPKIKDIKRNWHLVDASDKVLGRMSTRIANLLIGKSKVGYSMYLDSGDYVVVVNAESIKLTGKKELQKVYPSHSGYPGGYKEVKVAKLLEENPERVILHSVAGMLPDNRLKKDRLERLKIFRGVEHPYKSKFSKRNTK